MKDIEIEEIKSAAEYPLTKIRELYESSFRIDERVPWEFFEYDLKKKRRKAEGLLHLFGIRTGTETIGFGISIFYWEFTYPAYIAIEKKYRNKGIGSQLVMEIKEVAFRDAKKYKVAPLILFEVEKPELARNQEEKSAIFNRIKFYQKFNAIFLDVDYIEPPLLGKELPMYLVILTAPEINSVKSEALVRYIKTIYRQEYYLPSKKQEKYLQVLIKSINKREKVMGMQPI
ncbi:MAG: GNAT family N-acetyltransferase [Candidatus Helarchaeota archaeon]|nr:GNAT family N-acetyltransferase [Candidatus Helarchaeota archaeon]